MERSSSDRYLIAFLADAFVSVPVFLYFCFVKGDLTWHFGEYSFFSWSGSFFAECLRTPGGLSVWLGSLLSQFCSLPPVGAAVAAALAVAGRRLVAMMLRKEDESSQFIAAVPSFLLALFICGQDYSVYILKDHGLFFSQNIGFILGLIIYLVTSHLVERPFHILAAALIFSIAFPLIGFYSLFAALLLAVSLLKSKPWRGLILLAASSIVPSVCAISGQLYSSVNPAMMFLTGLPYRDFVGNWVLYLPLAGALIFTLLCPLVSKNIPLWAGLSIAAAGVCFLVLFTNYDRNLNIQLDMERAMARGEWDRVLEDAEKSDSPTRPIVIYRNIALYQRGELCDRMFCYPDGSEALATRADIPASIVISADAYYYTGLLNYAERWATELSVTYSKNVHLMKILAKVAMLTGDGQLARKYLKLIGGMMFQKRWAGRYSDLLDSGKPISDDSEFARILPLINASDDRRIISGEVAETVILHHFAASVPKNEDVYEWKMASLMTLKREAEFMDSFFKYKDLKQGCPKGIAQATILFGATSGDRDLYLKTFDTFNAEKEMLSEFSSFAKSYNSVPDAISDQIIARYKRTYGKTYWYYYYFVNDIKTN